MQTYQSTPDFYNDYISHHGILGMHWGKRNGPPYPLGAGDHSVSEKKAGWRKSLNSDPESNKKTITKKINKTGQKASNSEKQEKINREIDNTNVKKEEYGYGDTKFEFSILPVKKENGKYVEFQASELSDQQLKDSAKDYKKNEKQIRELAKEAILDDPYIYDSWIKDYHNMSKQDFINKLEIKSVYCTENGAEVSVWEKSGYGSLLGGHSLDMEFDLKNPKKPKWVAMNG